MKSKLLAWTALALVLAIAGTGYRWMVPPASAQGEAYAPATHDKTDRKVLYWKDPDGKPDFSPTPAKTQDGRDYVPVYEDEEKSFARQPPSAVEKKANKGRRILYYRNPMGLPDTSPVPKKDWMGMDYIPVYEGEEQGGGAVTVSLDKVQRSGVRTEEARMARLERPVRAPAIAKPDERTLRVVSLRADAFIEKLYVNETGMHVKAGEPLFRIYSPQMVTAQVNYQVAERARNPTMGTLGAEQQLQNLELPPSVLAKLKSTGEPVMAIDWPSPASGVVMEKRAIEGQMARMGDELMRIVDLSTIWIIADVPEQELARIAVGMPAKVTFRALPGEVAEGRVTFVLHELDQATRTGKVRIEVKNPDHHIKHEMYAEAEIDTGAGEGERLAVPASAVIDSGRRQAVLVERGEGKFEPRQVKLGVRGEGLVEIREGVSAGEKVVISANFLIDAESNLKAALSRFSADQPTQNKPASGEKNP